MPDNSALNLPDLALLNFRRHALDDTLGGKSDGSGEIIPCTGAAGENEVVIIGSGPSAANFDPAKHPGAFVIVLNGAVRTYGELAHVWVMIEEQVWDFPWAVQPNYRKWAVLSLGCMDSLPDSIRDAYPPRFWLSQALYCRRTQYNGQPLTSMRTGLVQYSAHGGVALQGIHVGEIAKANSGRPTYMYGTEFWFPEGAQHFYGDKPYEYGAGLTNVCRFYVNEDFKPVTGEGEFESTPFFVMSSMACRKVIGQAGLNVVDMSGGLLDPVKFVAEHGHGKITERMVTDD